MKKINLDAEEQELLDSYNRGEWKPVQNLKQEVKKAEEASRKFMQKDARVNIRMSSHDLDGLKQIAAHEGLSYQTLIGSVIHKFVAQRAALN